MTNQTADGNTTDVQFLSIQTAQSGSLSQINATAYELELNNVANDTIQFSDRPNRIVETVSTSDFVGNWTAGLNSFAADAPNDALIVEDTPTGNLETYVMESFSPVYDTNTNTLTYTIVAENATSVGLPEEFGQTVLVIDVATNTVIATIPVG
jgi:DNA-binding beta-propeller fold protein YncE